MQLEHETIRDDYYMDLYFSYVIPPSGFITTHWHNHMELLYVTDNEMDARINEVTYHLCPGDLLIVNPGDLHHTTAYESPCSYVLLQIPNRHLESIGKNPKSLRFQEYISATRLAQEDLSEIRTIFPELIRLDKEKTTGYRLQFLSSVYRLLFLLYTYFGDETTEKNRVKTDRDLQRIETVMRYVRKNYAQPLTLADVAGELSITTEYFCRLFRKMTGQTFLSYLNQIRMLHFYQDLLHSEESITYLLEKNGITNYKVFMRDFKKTYHKTPVQLRKEHR